MNQLPYLPGEICAGVEIYWAVPKRVSSRTFWKRVMPNDQRAEFYIELACNFCSAINPDQP